MDNAENSNPLKVKFSGPAKNWNDAAPIGNGRLGAMVWGGVPSELIQLNEDTLWTGNPGNYTNPDAPAALSEVRKLVDSGKFPAATAAAAKLTGNPTEVYQLLGDLKLEFDDSHAGYLKQTYGRELDLDTATVKVKYSVGSVEYSREHFASFPDKVILTKLSASQPGSLSFMVCLDSLLGHHSYVSSETRIIMEGACPGERIPPPPEVRKGNDPKGIHFCAVLDLRISDGNGTVNILDDNKLKVEGSDWAVLLLVSASSFEGPFVRPSDSERDPKSDSILVMNSMRNLSYSELYARHINDYQRLFQQVSLQLWKSSDVIDFISPEGSDADGASTADRVRSFVYDEDPSMIELLFQFGRYLLISCSRPGSQVANLQGIWNKDLQPKWESAPHLNINLQMNYWPSLPCNLAECQEPLFDYISSLSINGAKTAEVNYEAGGWVVHHDTDIWAKSSPIKGDAKYSIWPMGGAWLCTHLWEHYCYTMDKEFLKTRAYPLLEGCTSFLLDWLIEGPDGYLETNPSTSPEHNFIAPDGELASVSYSSTMDIAIIKEVFSAVAAAAEVLGTSESDLVNKVRKAQTRLRPTKISRDGTIMEWALEFKDPEPQHRHLSHLFGLFPGHTITTEENPDLCKATENSLYKRGEDGPGWSTAWKIALWARLCDSEHAYWMVKHLFTLVDPDHEVSFRGGLYSNLFAAHPPFQIDANFGFTAAIAEILVQSTLTDLYLLPALLEDKWGSGRICGLQARGGVTVNIHWEGKKLHKVEIWSKHQTSLERLHYKGASVKLALAPGKVHTYNSMLRLVKTCLL